MDLLGSSLTPLEGGHSGESFLAETAGERTVVRIYGERSLSRGPNAAEIDAAVLRLVRGLLPVPEVLEVRRADESAGTPGLLITSHLPGDRLDLLLPQMSDAMKQKVGRNLGEILARLAQMPMLRPGMFEDGDLRIGPMPPGATDLTEWVASHLEGTALERWPTEDQAGLVAVADAAAGLLDLVDRASLAHSDFNPKNLLVDHGSGTVTGVVDWEFAHAGSPYTDLGNLLRFDRDPAFAEAALSTYISLSPPAPADPLDLARAADLWALVDLAGRKGQNPVTEQADELLRAIARARDLHTEL